MTLKVVVLPAPFGPMTPTIWRGPTSSEISRQRMDAAERLADAGPASAAAASGRAHAAPPATRRRGTARGRAGPGGAPAASPPSSAPNAAKPPIRQEAQILGQHHQQHRADQRAGRHRRAAENHGEHEVDRALEARNCRARYRRGDARTARRQIAATAAPKPNAPTLIAVALRPTRPAAVSSSRTARISSQTRERSSNDDQRAGCRRPRSRCSRARYAACRESRRSRPSAPKLRKKLRTISPKPSVAIAR